MKSFIVYKHTSPSGKSYIGITSLSINARWKNGNGYKTQQYFYRAIQKYGWDSFTHEILFCGLSKEEACIKEKELIIKYDTQNEAHGYNVANGGNHSFHSDVTKKKMSIAWEERRNNPEIMAKYHRCGTQNNRYGLKGKDCKKAIPINQYTKSGEYIATYYGAAEAERETLINHSHITEACKGIRKSAGGFVWKICEV